MQRRWKGALSTQAVPRCAGARTCPDLPGPARERLGLLGGQRPAGRRAKQTRVGPSYPPPGRVLGHLEDSLEESYRSLRLRTRVLHWCAESWVTAREQLPWPWVPVGLWEPCTPKILKDGIRNWFRAEQRTREIILNRPVCCIGSFRGTASGLEGVGHTDVARVSRGRVGGASPLRCPAESVQAPWLRSPGALPAVLSLPVVPHGARHCPRSETARNTLTACLHVLHPCFKQSEIQLLLCDSISNLQHSVKSESSPDGPPLSGASSSPRITSLLALRLFPRPAARACLLSARSAPLWRPAQILPSKKELFALSSSPEWLPRPPPPVLYLCGIYKSLSWALLYSRVTSVSPSLPSTIIPGEYGWARCSPCSSWF